MKIKNLLLVGVIGLFTLAVGNAKSYDLIFSSPTKAGNVQLKPGEYRLTVKGNTATFLNVNNAKTFSTDVKLESTNTKYSDTQILSNQDKGTNVVTAIDLGGSKTQVDF